jgi:hypothetical protein
MAISALYPYVQAKIAETVVSMNRQPELSTACRAVTFHNAENDSVSCARRRVGTAISVVGHAATIAAGQSITASGEWVNDRIDGGRSKARFTATDVEAESRSSRLFRCDGMEQKFAAGGSSLPDRRSGSIILFSRRCSPR